MLSIPVDRHARRTSGLPDPHIRYTILVENFIHMLQKAALCLHVVENSSVLSTACLLVHPVNSRSIHLYRTLIHGTDLWCSFCTPGLCTPFRDIPCECLDVIAEDERDKRHKKVRVGVYNTGSLTDGRSWAMPLAGPTAYMSLMHSPILYTITDPSVVLIPICLFSRLSFTS